MTLRWTRPLALVMTAALAVALAVVVDAPGVGAARPANALTFNSVIDIEPAAGAVFITGRPGPDEVAVHDPDGTYASTITGLVNAQGLDLSDDGDTLYVGMSGAGSIGVIDVASRSLVDVIDVVGKPWTVQQAGSRLIYNDVQSGSTVALRTYDLTDGSTGSLDLTANALTLDVVPAASDLAVVARGPGRLNRLSVLDVSADDPVIEQTVDIAASSSLALTADASAVVVGEREGNPSAARVYATSDLSLTDTLPGVPGSMYGSATTAGRGGVATVTSKRAGVYLKVHSLNEDAPIRVGVDTQVLYNGVAFSPNGNRLYIAKDDDRGSDYERLAVISSPTMTPVSIKTNAKNSVPIGATVEVTGVIKDGLGGVPDDAEVVAKRVSKSGTKSLGRLTPRSNGSFTLRDKPNNLGTYRYTFSYAGNATRLATSATERVTVAKLKPALRVTTDRKVYAYQGTAKVRAYLGDTASNRTVTILANPARGKTVVVARGRVDRNGNLTGRHTMRYDTTFIAKFGGDELYQRREVTDKAGARTRIATSMRGWYGKSGNVHLYRQGESGVLHLEVTPDVTGSLFVYYTQIYSGGRWGNGFSSGAEYELGKGSQSTVLVGGYDLDDPTLLRTRVIVYGGPSNSSTKSGWELFRVG